MKYIDPKRFTYRDEDGRVVRQRPTPPNKRLELLAEFTTWMFERLNSSRADDVVGDPIKYNAKMITLWFEFHEERTWCPEQLKEAVESTLAEQTLASLLKEVKS